MARTPEHSRAKSDLKRAVTEANTWNALAYSDIRSKYRLSTFGSLWITLTTGSLAVAIGLIYGQFFGVDIRSYLPYFTASYITWILISSVINEASTTLIGSGNLIKSSQMPILFYVLRMLQRHLYIAGHNVIVVVGVWLVLRWEVGFYALLSIIGLVLCHLFLVGLSLVISIVCVRYRDVPPLIQALTQFLFFATPIIWYPEQLRFGEIVLRLNPVAYMLMVVRDPLLGRPTEPMTWIVAALVAVFSLLFGATVYIHYRRRIAYWV
jgi:ABC-type polysaccharide/polyol phosphate export permease